MAEKIKVIKRLENSREYNIKKNIEDLQGHLSDKKIALEKGLEILEALEEAQALDALHALVVQRKVITGNFVNELNKEMYSGILGNIGNVLFLLGDLDLEEASKFLSKINNGMKVANKSDLNRKTTLKDLMGALKDPEINKSITLMLNFLKGMGRE